MKSLHNTKYRAYMHKRINISQEVIRSRELALATAEEMSPVHGKLGVTNLN